jgi:hypothetical protein
MKGRLRIVFIYQLEHLGETLASYPCRKTKPKAIPEIVRQSDVRGA